MNFIKRNIDIYECGPICSVQRAIHPGVYFIYVGKPKGEGDFLYIGRSERPVCERINDHLEDDIYKHDCWMRVAELKRQELCFAACKINSEIEREEIEAALIFTLQPRCNDNHRKKYIYRSIAIDVNSKFSEFSIPPVTVASNWMREPYGNICSCGK